MEGIKLIPGIALMIAVAGIVLGATAITISTFGDSMTECWNTTYTINTSGNYCLDNVNNINKGTAGPEGTNLSYEYYTTIQTLEGGSTIAEQIPTVAIIAVMVIIISVLAGVFVYFRYFG